MHHPFWMASKRRGRGGATVVGKPRLTKAGRRRQTGQRPTTVVGRTCLCYSCRKTTATATRICFFVFQFGFLFIPMLRKYVLFVFGGWRACSWWCFFFFSLLFSSFCIVCRTSSRGVRRQLYYHRCGFVCFRLVLVLAFQLLYICFSFS